MMTFKFSFEPFTEGMSAGDSAELVDDPTNRESTATVYHPQAS